MVNALNTHTHTHIHTKFKHTVKQIIRQHCHIKGAKGKRVEKQKIYIFQHYRIPINTVYLRIIIPINIY